MFDQGGATLRKNNQNGFFSIEGIPRENLIKTVTEINRQVYIHSLHPATPEELEILDIRLYDTWQKHLRGRTLWGH
jgi:hypothetical protein